MKTPDKLDVVVVGDLFVDLILSDFDYWPQPGRESFARRFGKEAGGGAAITACGLAKLGVSTGVFGVAGESDGEWLIARLRASGVNISEIRLHDSEPTAFSVVASTAADRAFLTYGGANKALPDELLKAARSGQFAGTRHLHLACAFDPDRMMDIIDVVRRGGCSVSLDVGWRPEWLDHPKAGQVLRCVDLFFPNEAEALRITGADSADQALEYFAELGLAKVALKMGSRGAALLWDTLTFRSSPHPVNPIDVTGAGDCFDAGFLYAWRRARPAQECLDIANLCGAISTEAHGGLAGFPGVERLAQFGF